MQNVLEYLERTAEQYPDRIAVDDGNTSLNWTELLDFSRRAGTALCGMVKAGGPVVILKRKSAMTLALMFGVVYAGCFYVVIDPEQPPARMKKMIDVLEPELVATEAENQKALERTGYRGPQCLVQDMFCQSADCEKLDRIRANSRDTDLLYGMFTSGSTGTPKSVVVSHQAVIQFITHFVEIFGITKDDRIGNQAPFDFDVSVKDIYASLMTGARLILIPKEFFSIPPRLLDFLCEKKITTLTWAVSALCLVSALKGLQYKVPADVNRVLFSGEAMPAKQLRKWQEALPEADFVNLYGPSEITCNCTWYRVSRMFEDGERIPAGKPFPGREVFLLDEKGQKVTAPDRMGEICVAGESLAEGYYHNQKETDARFIRRLDGTEKQRYYKTGDLGFYDSSGNLCFAGRKDFQIKHMGHRIELEEIEQALEQIQGLEKGWCLLDPAKNRLTAFYLGEAPADEMKKKLREFLPDYMIPHKMVKLTEMPLTKNGKIDREYLLRTLEAPAK